MMSQRRMHTHYLDDNLDSMAGFSWFITRNLANGYWHGILYCFYVMNGGSGRPFWCLFDVQPTL